MTSALAKPFYLTVVKMSKKKAYFETPPLDKYYRGPVELAFMRSTWESPDALFIGIKAGYNEVNHAHLDLGNFELDALGVRWVSDMGSDHYNLPGYFNKDQRYQYYRTNSFSHNIPTVNGMNQSKTGRSRIQRFVSGENADNHNGIPLVEIDLSEAYESPITSIKRGAALIENRRAALIQDDISLERPADIDWGFTTRADAEVTGSTVTLMKDDKKMKVKILSPKGATFSIESAEQSPPQMNNKGFRRVMIHLEQQSGPVRISVLFTPVWPEGEVTFINSEISGCGNNILLTQGMK